MKHLIFYLLLIYGVSFGQTDRSKAVEKTTPFNPNGNYQTFALRLRLLPYIIGDNKGYNALGGLQFSFLKNHSLSADIMKEYKNSNIDAFYRNDSLIKPSRARNESTMEIHLAYNYHFGFESLRKNIGLSFYTGINYRIGKRQLVSDTGMYINDNTVSSNRQYYSIGPQIGLLYNFGHRKHLALNINLTPFYTVKKVTTTESQGAHTFIHHDTFKTYDFRLGLNLILWIRYFKRGTKAGSI